MLGTRRAVALIVLLVVAGVWLALFSGCGGGGSPTPTPEPEVPAASAPYSAHFDVNVTTGQVTVTPAVAADTVGTAAVLTGSAVAFSSSSLVDEGGDVGVKALAVTVKNQTQRQLTNARLLFSDFVNVAAWSDLRSQTLVSTLAGSGAAGFTNGSATSAQLSGPSGVTVDSRGDIFIADTDNNRVRKLSGRNLSTYAGDGTAASKNGLGAAAQLNAPLGIVYCGRDASLYVVQRAGNRVSRIDPTGYVSTIAGTGAAGSANGTGAVATFNGPTGITSDGDALYVSDTTGNCLRKIVYTSGDARAPASYTVSTIAGSGVASSVDGVGTAATLNAPYGLTYGYDGALYVAEANGNRVRRVEPGSKAVVTIAGTGAAGSSDNYGNTATFRRPQGIVALPDRGRGISLVVAEYDGHTLRQLRLDADGGAAPGHARSWIVQTLAGEPLATGSADGTGTNARFYGPRLLGADASGNVLIADRSNHKLRQLRPASGAFPLGTATGVAPPTEPVVLANAAGFFPWEGGNPRAYLTCGNISPGADLGPLTWTFTIPDGVTAFEFTVTLEAATNPYAPVEAVNENTSGGNGSSRVLVTTLAGDKDADGFIDGMGVNARFRSVVGIALDDEGCVYACDADNDAVRRVEPSGRVSTVAGVYGKGTGFANGRGNVAQFAYPVGLAVVPEGVFSTAGTLPFGTDATFLVVADLNNFRVRLIRSPHDGWTTALPWEPWNPAFYQVATIAGTGVSGYTNGRGDTAQFAAPGAVAVGPGGIIYVLERSSGNRVRQLHYTGGDPMAATNWQVSLLAGSTSGATAYVDASGSSARFYDPRGIAAGRDGNVYVADTYNHCIRQITPGGAVTTLAGLNVSGYEDATGTAARFYCPWAIAAGPDGYLYVADRYNHRIRRVSPTGAVTTVAGTGSTTAADGPGNASGFNDDLGIAVSPSGELYVAEAESLRVIHRIIDVGDAGS